MLRQIIMALKTLHGIGYSHGDLKPANICVRRDSKGRLKFTLIDFGICQRLPKLGDSCKKNRSFRGNLMFASDWQLRQYTATQYCDLTSLAGVAYYIVNEKEMPMTAYKRQHPEANFMCAKEYARIRLENAQAFERELANEDRNPFHKLYKFLLRMRDAINYPKSDGATKPTAIDYHYLLKLIPSGFSINAHLKPLTIKSKSASRTDEDCSHFSDMSLSNCARSWEGVELP